MLSQNHEVVAVDVVPEKIELINNKVSPIQDEYFEKFLIERDLNLTATLNAREAYSKADFVIIVLDSSKELSKEDYEILDLCKNSTGVVLVNKSDLEQTLKMEEIRNLSGKDVISFSAAKGDGLDKLESYIKRQFIESKIEEKDDLYITNARQKEALVQTKDSLEKVLESIERKGEAL